MSNQDDQKKKAAVPHFSDMILGSLKPRTGRETSKWIAGLSDEEGTEAVTEQPEAPPPAPVQQPVKRNSKQDMVHLLDHIFDCFQQYEYDFNRTVVGTDLVVSIDRPQWATEVIRHKFQPSESVQVFRGKISTRQWTLFIRGRKDMVEGWVMPIDKLISFTTDQNAFVRFLLIEGTWKKQNIFWAIDGDEVPWEAARSLAKQLFGALVKIARGEASDSEPFTLREKAMVDRSYEKLAAIQMQPEVKYSFNERNPDFDGQFTTATKLPHVKPVHATSMTSETTRRASESSSKLLKAPTPQVIPPQPQMAAAAPDVTRQPQQHQQHQQPQQHQRQNVEPQRLRTNSVPDARAIAAPKGSTHSQQEIESIMEALSKVVATELDNLSKAGAEAFSRHDLTEVERAMKKATKVKDLQTEICSQVEVWKARLRDAVQS